MSCSSIVDDLDFLGGGVDISMLFGVEDTAFAPTGDGGLNFAAADVNTIKNESSPITQIAQAVTTNSEIIDLTVEDNDVAAPSDNFGNLFGSNMENNKTFGQVDLTADDVANKTFENGANVYQGVDAIVEQFEDSQAANEIADYLANQEQGQELFENDFFGGIDPFQTFQEFPCNQSATVEQLPEPVRYGADGSYSSPDRAEENVNASKKVPSAGKEKLEKFSPPVKVSTSPSQHLEDIIQRIGGEKMFQERYKAWRCLEKRPLPAIELSISDIVAQQDFEDFFRSVGGSRIPSGQFQLLATSKPSEYPVAKDGAYVTQRRSDSPTVGFTLPDNTSKISSARQSFGSSYNKLPNNDVAFPTKSGPIGSIDRLSRENSGEATSYDAKAVDDDPQFQHYIRQWSALSASPTPVQSHGQVQVGNAPQQEFAAQGYHQGSGTIPPASSCYSHQVQPSVVPKTRTPPKVSRKKSSSQGPKEIPKAARDMYIHFGYPVPNSGSAGIEQGVTSQSNAKPKAAPKPRRRSKGDVQVAKPASSGLLPGENAGLVQPRPVMPLNPNQVAVHLQMLTRVAQEQRYLIEQQKALIQAQGGVIAHLAGSKAGQGHVGHMAASRSSSLPDVRFGNAGYFVGNHGSSRKRSSDVSEPGMADKRHRTGSAIYDDKVSPRSSMVSMMASANVHPAEIAKFVHQGAFSAVVDQDLGENIIPMEVVRGGTPCPAPRSRSRKARSVPVSGSMVNDNSNESSSQTSGDSAYVPS